MHIDQKQRRTVYSLQLSPCVDVVIVDVVSIDVTRLQSVRWSGSAAHSADGAPTRCPGRCPGWGAASWRLILQGRAVIRRARAPAVCRGGLDDWRSTTGLLLLQRQQQVQLAVDVINLHNNDSHCVYCPGPADSEGRKLQFFDSRISQTSYY